MFSLIDWRWTDKGVAEIWPLIISSDPDGKVGVYIVKPGGKCHRVCGVPIHSSGDDSTAGGIMPAVRTIGIRHATGCIAVPLKICAILAERPAEPDVLGGIHPWIGAGKKVMQTEVFGVGNNIVG